MRISEVNGNVGFQKRITADKLFMETYANAKQMLVDLNKMPEIKRYVGKIEGVNDTVLLRGRKSGFLNWLFGKRVYEGLSTGRPGEKGYVAQSEVSAEKIATRYIELLG